FEVPKLTYIHPLLFPVMYAFRIFDRRKKEGFGARDDFRDFGPILNKIFQAILIADGYLARYINYPFGTTIISVWRKK
ncbi:MAG: hypothetical protein Q8R48_06440, partial [Candidatus Omnitrophota bacterium]|nr:hypothetical protein [Candidatus Omnitrophota bacterium]